MVRSQPESLRFYIRVLLGLVGPCFELLLAFHTYQMPLKGLRLRRLYNQVALERGEGMCKAEGDEVPYAPPRASRIGVSLFENAVLTYKGHLMAGVVYSPARLENAISLIDKGPGKKSATVIFYGQDGDEAVKSIQQVRSSFHDAERVGSPKSSPSATDAEVSTDGDADTLPSKPEPTCGRQEVMLPSASGLDGAERDGTELAFVASRESASTLPWPPPQLVPRVVHREDSELTGPDSETAGHPGVHALQASYLTGLREPEVQCEAVLELEPDDACHSPYSQTILSL